MGSKEQGGHVSPDVPAWVNTQEPAPWKANKEATMEEICRRLERGLPLSRIVSPQDPTMPAYPTVMEWIRTNEKFRDNYDEARKRQAQLWVDQMMEIAFTPPWEVALSPELQRKIDSGEVSAIIAQGLLKAAVSAEMQRRRLLIDSIKWFAGKMVPKIYGNLNKGDDTDDDDCQVSFTDYSGESDE
jgi:hypothetical protein